MSDYEQRAETYHFTPPDELKSVLQQTDCVVMDVRSQQEIQQDGKFQIPTCAWVQRACAPSGPCDLIDQKVDDLLPSKHGAWCVVL
jgi:hypothetical protein